MYIVRTAFVPYCDMHMQRKGHKTRGRVSVPSSPLSPIPPAQRKTESGLFYDAAVAAARYSSLRQPSANPPRETKKLTLFNSGGERGARGAALCALYCPPRVASPQLAKTRAITKKKTERNNKLRTKQTPLNNDANARTGEENVYSKNRQRCLG